MNKKIIYEDYIIEVSDQGEKVGIVVGGGPMIKFTKETWRKILEAILEDNNPHPNT